MLASVGYSAALQDHNGQGWEGCSWPFLTVLAVFFFVSLVGGTLLITATESIGMRDQRVVLLSGRTYQTICQAEGKAIVHENFTEIDFPILAKDQLPKKFLYEKKQNDKGEIEFFLTPLT